MCENARIGIFWRVPFRGGFVLVADAIPLSAAELYGDCLTYPRGHYEVWEEWRRLSASELLRRNIPPTIKGYEYEALPRGRTVYKKPQKRFAIYADRKLLVPHAIRLIVERFGLEDQAWEMSSDPHYVS